MSKKDAKDAPCKCTGMVKVVMHTIVPFTADVIPEDGAGDVASSGAPLHCPSPGCDVWTRKQVLPAHALHAE